ncbi:MAG: hypothetical protein LC793_12160 [Thermomicrobia bacterium]|nr:hypothetical protein [Thermomicrobia bacterium]
MKNGGTVAAIGAMALAVLCCAGLPLMIGAIAAVGMGGVLGGVGVAVMIALIAIATMTIITRRRQHRA